MKTDLKSNREYIARRGHMLAFLLVAYAGTIMINNYQEPINLANNEYIDSLFQA